MLSVVLSGKIKLKSLEDSDTVHKILFSLGYKYQTKEQEYPKTKPYGIAWYNVGDSFIIRKTNIKDIFVSYSCNTTTINKLLK
jgi:hypothetical protein